MSIEGQHKNHLLQIFNEALLSVHGRSVAGNYLANLKLVQPVRVIAIGKAAEAMAAGAIDVLGQRDYQCLIISKRYANGETGPPPDFDDKRVTIIRSGHPLPDEHSLQAGQALLEFIHQSSRDTEFLFLISGGASSLVEVLPDDVVLDDVKKVNQWLLASGFTIEQMNAVRKSLSCIKGGRLAKELYERKAQVLLISDVPGDDISVIGSGLLVADTASSQLLASLDLPVWLQQLTSFAPPVPKENDACFQYVDVQVVADNKCAQLAAKNEAMALGYVVCPHDEVVTGDIEDVAKHLVDELRHGKPGIYIWGGETTVRLPAQPGRGGRNQSLALAAARHLAGLEGVLLLVAATDGSDGPGNDAGGLVDGRTIEAGLNRGLQAADFLARADAGTFLSMTGALVSTGPTGTNVMDLMIALKL